MAADIESLLASLRPVAPGDIMDMVEAAGIDVEPWALKKDGTPSARPKANPQYCYEWAFGGDGQPTALCVWHRNLRTDGGQIVYEESLRKHALGLDRVATTRDNPAHVKIRARDQARRARHFDSLLQRAFRRSQPIRVILLVGEQRDADELGWDTSRVRYRRLDTEPWSVVSYSDEEGAFRIVRGVPISHTVDDASEGLDEHSAIPPETDEKVQDESSSASQPTYVDQFSIPEAAERVETTGSASQRSPEVRRRVLERAKGSCECCGASGFRMANGAIYLETHHVIPLSRNGPDVEWNVVAICPNDHRRAHFAVEQREIRADLIAKLTDLSPRARDALTELNASLDAAENP